MQKARRHTLLRRAIVLRPLVGAWFQVHIPPLSRGSSHLSVALLSSLSVVREYLALRDGPRRFSRDSTWLDLLRYLSGGQTIAAYGTVTLYGRPFQGSSANGWLCNSHVRGPTTPQRKTSAVWAISRSLAATEEIDFSFFSTRY